MTLNAATLIDLHNMFADGGRYTDGRFRSTYTGITCNCNDADHDRCSGWIHPIAGVNECACPCHDDHRTPYREALAATVKALDWWRIGDVVTIAGAEPSSTRWTITFVDHVTNVVHVVCREGELNGERAVAEFLTLALCTD